jgi:hypothetical protein
MPRRRRGHGWTRRRPLQLQLPPPPTTLSQVRTSPRLAHYYDRGLVCPRGQFHWNYVTKASSPFFPPNQWRSLVSVVVKPTSNVDLWATVIHAVGARSIIFIVFFIHRCRPPPLSLDTDHAPPIDETNHSNMDTYIPCRLQLLQPRQGCCHCISCSRAWELIFQSSSVG